MESAGACCEETVQAQTVRMTELERRAGRQGIDLSATLGRARRLFLRKPNGHNTYELLNNNRKKSNYIFIKPFGVCIIMRNDNGNSYPNL